MQKQIFLLLFISMSTILYAQTANKTLQPDTKRSVVKEGVKMYELKMDANAKVVVVDPKTDKKEVKQSHKVTPVVKEETKNKH